MKLWKKVYFFFGFFGGVFGFLTSIIFEDSFSNAEFLPLFLLVISGMLLGVPFGMVIDKEISRKEAIA
ncbi:MAG: hypothetical protein J7L31_05410 [Thermoplasmata archaeon]|nr:hypothetical protein [Thermoplasmata archaeon]